jgi:hypothetical protein
MEKIYHNDADSRVLSIDPFPPISD